jgi:hypothetical protein
MVLFVDLLTDLAIEVTYLPTVDVFHSSLTKEEIHEIALGHGAHKVGC